jgi:hypothetical protein
MKTVKRAFLPALFVLPLVIAVPAFSQEASSSSKELNTQAYIELLKTDANAKHEAVVTYIMQLSDADAKVFGPIYREYNDELSKLNAAEAQEIEAYAKNYDKISDKEAEDVVNKSLHLEAERVALKKKYFEKMKSALSPSAAAKFYEIDSQFQDIVHLQATSALPATP